MVLLTIWAAVLLYYAIAADKLNKNRDHTVCGIGLLMSIFMTGVVFACVRALFEKLEFLSYYGLCGFWPTLIYMLLLAVISFGVLLTNTIGTAWQMDRSIASRSPNLPQAILALGIVLIVLAVLPWIGTIIWLMYSLFLWPNNLVGREAHRLSNNFRVKQGLKALWWSATMTSIGYPHSVAMACKKVPFGHANFDDRAKQVPYKYGHIAENVGFTSNVPKLKIPEVIVKGWIDSPGHRKNLLCNATHAGIAVYTNREGVTFLTQLFVQKE